jgi:hypothetical protein
LWARLIAIGGTFMPWGSDRLRDRIAAAVTFLMLGWKVVGQFAADTVGLERDPLDHWVSQILLTLLR